jgi:hypothetical protein
MHRSKRLVVPMILTAALVASCDGPKTMDASIDSNDNNVARCDTPDAGTMCASCYTASGATIIDCQNCLGVDNMTHVLC